MSKLTTLKELEILIENHDYNFLNKELLDFANEIKSHVKTLQTKEERLLKDAYIQGNEDGFHSIESQSDYEIEGRNEYYAENYIKSVFSVIS